MKPEPEEAHPDSVNGVLADYLCERKEVILSEWTARVRGDTAITRTESLNAEELSNHMPNNFDDLIAGLRRFGSETGAAKATQDAEKHGAVRWRQGYNVPEVLREIMHLRIILLYHNQIFEVMHPEFGLAARLFIATTVNRFLDEMAIDATEEFLNPKAEK